MNRELLLLLASSILICDACSSSKEPEVETTTEMESISILTISPVSLKTKKSINIGESTVPLMPTSTSPMITSKIMNLESFEFEPRPGGRMTLLQFQICNDDYEADHRNDCCYSKDFYKRSIKWYFEDEVGNGPKPCKAFEIKTYPMPPRIAISYETNANTKVWNITRIQFYMLEEKSKIVCLNVSIEGPSRMISHECEWQ